MRSSVILFLILFFSSYTFAQSLLPDNNFSFDVGFVDGFLSFGTLVKQPDGKLLINVRGYYSVNDHTTRTLFRLNADLTLDKSFKTNINSTSYVEKSCIDFQSDGRIIIGAGTDRLYRLNTDGSIDTSFKGSGLNGTIKAVKVDADDRIIVLGNFTGFKDLPAPGIIRLNSDGSLDETFNVGSGMSVIGLSPCDINIQSDGKILVAGDFNGYNGSAVRKVIRINADGTLDDSFLFPFTQGTPAFIVPQPDDKIVVIGKGEGEFSGIVRLKSDGSIDNSFTETALSEIPKFASNQNDGKILIGTVPVIRLNNDGSKDNSFSLYPDPFNGAAEVSDEKILLAFTSGLYTLDQSGITTAVPDLHFQILPRVDKIIFNEDNDVIIAGSFKELNHEVSKSLVVLDKTGVKKAGFNFFSDDKLRDMTVAEEGKIYFAAETNTSQGKIVRVNPDGSHDMSFASGSGFGQNTIGALCVTQSGKLVTDGPFSSYNGISFPAAHIVRLNGDGSFDSDFFDGMPAELTNGSTADIVEQPDGKLLVGGSRYLFRLNEDGTLDNSFQINTSQNASKIALDKNGRIYFGYTTIVRLNADGTPDESFNTSDVFTSGIPIGFLDIRILPDDKVLVAGMFNGSNNSRILKVYRLNHDGSQDSSFNLELPFKYPELELVHSFNFNRDGFYIAGTFRINEYESRVLVVKALSGLSDPSSLVANASTSTSVELTWVDNSTTESGYEIERATSEDGPFELIHTTVADVSSYTDNNLTANTDYFYRIRGFNVLGYSDYSTLTNVRTPKLSQSISFAELPEKHLQSEPFELDATASSGLPVTFSSSDPQVASIDGKVVTIKAVGETTITAHQEGDDTYLPATEINRALKVSLYTDVELVAKTVEVVYPNPSKGVFNVKMKSSGCLISYSVLNSIGREVAAGVVDANGSSFDVDLYAFPAGIYSLRTHSCGGTTSSRLVKN